MLEKKIVFVTGATRGIGFASAKVFARAGAIVLLGGRDSQKLKEAIDAIRIELPEARLFPILCDVADEKSVKAAYQKIFSTYKRLDVLLANAGVLHDALIGMVTTAQIQEVFGVNTFGVLYCSQYASRLMAKSGGGSIIIVSSIIGTNGNVGQAVYGGSKAAVIGIAKSLAKELAEQNIRVNAITPGFIDTDMARSLSDEKFSERIASIKMGRIGKPEEVANVALFLASDLSSYVTGQVIGVDGGMLI
ncbi:3-oxoacyl-ACP reductase [Chlorobaculum limnaeum]|uniref:3-oxoacyl-ACP reductase n=1 Tax=Chlorobaculum limnaeum TaxID=274537 RepID=A0A1D8CVA4_CHLLM|nr:SDR family NAD(P)-dependent oxidoreductase [Chlorobaculum limnaeum]AOS82762.1 3-oxoacyl-ACP reductase [Chlorobaculum limnaeum]